MHGTHFFMNPGPTNIPDRILRAMDRGAIDFTGAEFKAIAEECFAGLKPVFKTEGTILAYAATGHGAWEAALVNLFSPGDQILVVESGFFSLNWGMRGEAFGLDVETLPKDWRHPADPGKLEARLREDREHRIKAVLLVHCETSTGVINPVAELRRAIDAAGHPALFLVDTISSLASIDFRMDEWGVDVVVAGSQKGLMLPTGMAFTAVSAKALAAARRRRSCRASIGTGSGSSAKARRPIGTARRRCISSTGCARRCACWRRRGSTTSSPAIIGWPRRRGARCAPGPAIAAPRSTRSSRRPSRTRSPRCWCPKGVDADAVRQTALDRFNVSLGGGLDRLKGRVFRIGHLGDLNEPMLLGALAAIEMALDIVGVPHGSGGVNCRDGVSRLSRIGAILRPAFDRRRRSLHRAGRRRSKRLIRRGGKPVSRPRAADDFATIRARMEELRREREQSLSGQEAGPARSGSRRESDAERRRRERIEGVPPPWVPTIFVRKPRG